MVIFVIGQLNTSSEYCVQCFSLTLTCGYDGEMGRKKVQGDLRDVTLSCADGEQMKAHKVIYSASHNQKVMKDRDMEP